MACILSYHQAEAGNDYKNHSQTFKRYALLVGVSEYEFLSEKYQLEGPANDVRLIRATLLNFGFPKKNIKVLSDNSNEDSRPTSANILSEIDKLVDLANERTQIFLYFAGHGSQQPNNNSEKDKELDGMDEIFLPSDVKSWNGQIGSVENALVDDDLNRRVLAMRNKKAFVWAVFDSCHSGTIVRGPDLGSVYRNVKPKDLGIPIGFIEQSLKDSPSIRGAIGENGFLETPISRIESAGGFIGFYASQTSQKTPELLLPRDALPSDRKKHGLFTYTLVGILNRFKGISYRQTAQQILHEYAMLGKSQLTPLFEGADIDMDRSLFDEQLKTIQQWPIEINDNIWQIEAGKLHRLSENTILAIVPNAAIVDDKNIVGYTKVVETTSFTSILRPSSYLGHPAPVNIPKGAFARVIDRRFNLELTVALPDRHNKQTIKEDFVWKELNQLNKRGLKYIDDSDSLKIKFVSRMSIPNINLFIRDPNKSVSVSNPDSKLWLLPPSGEIIREGAAKSPAILIPDPNNFSDNDINQFRQKIATNLNRAARAITLLKLVGELSANNLSRSIKVKLKIHRKNSCKIETPKMITYPNLYEGDELKFSVINSGKRAIDLTVLFVDSRYRILAWFPYYPGESNRLEPRENIKSGLRVGTDTVGIERLIFIAAIARDKRERADFSFWAQEALTIRGGPLVGLPIGGATVLEMLNTAGVNIGTLRSATRLVPVELVTAKAFSWNVIPER